ncbi:MAG: hypothetical protein GY856_36745 [bacterium]|nr:hypothetical protein [bacterium]
MFWDLSNSRRGGFSGCEAISTTDARSWLWIHGVDEDEREECWSLVHAMDVRFRKTKSEEKPSP